MGFCTAALPLGPNESRGPVASWEAAHREALRGTDLCNHQKSLSKVHVQLNQPSVGVSQSLSRIFHVNFLGNVGMQAPDKDVLDPTLLICWNLVQYCLKL